MELVDERQRGPPSDANTLNVDAVAFYGNQPITHLDGRRWAEQISSEDQSVGLKSVGLKIVGCLANAEVPAVSRQQHAIEDLHEQQRELCAEVPAALVMFSRGWCNCHLIPSSGDY